MDDMIRNPYQFRPVMDEVINLDGRGEVYTFTPEEAPGGPVCLYLIPQILRWAQAKSEQITVYVDPEQAAKLCAARGIDPAEAQRVVVQRAQDGRGCPPVLIADWGKSQVVLDGNHRLVAWGMQGPQNVPAYLIKQEFLTRRGFCRLMSRKLYQELMEAA